LTEIGGIKEEIFDPQQLL